MPVLSRPVLSWSVLSSDALSPESRWQQRGFALPTWTRDGYAEK